MEQLIILLVIVVGSIISSILQNRKKRELEAEANQGETPAPPAPLPEWQERLKRMLQEHLPQQEAPPVIRPARTPPPVPPPIVPEPRETAVSREFSEGLSEFKDRMAKTAAAYEKTARMGDEVRSRFRQAVRPTPLKKMPQPARAPSAAIRARRWLQNPAMVREAFVASIIFAPPPGLQEMPESRI